MLPKRRFWKPEQKIGRVFSMHFSGVRVLYLGNDSLKSTETPNRLFRFPKSSFREHKIAQLFAATRRDKAHQPIYDELYTPKSSFVSIKFEHAPCACSGCTITKLPHFSTFDTLVVPLPVMSRLALCVNSIVLAGTL